MSACDYTALLEVAIAEARKGLAEGGVPIGAAIFDESGKPWALATTAVSKTAILQYTERPTRSAIRDGNAVMQAFIMVTTLAPCWYCSGLVRQFGFRTVVVGESRNFQGGMEWLRSFGVKVIDLDSEECASMLREYIRLNPKSGTKTSGRSNSRSNYSQRPVQMN